MRDIRSFIVDIILVNFIILSLSNCASREIKTDILISSSSEIKPRWLRGRLSPNQYRGIATGKNTEEDGLNDAYHDAVRKVIEEVGIKVNAVFERGRIEKGSVLNINVESRTRAETQGFIQGAKVVDTYIEKYKRTKPITYYYNAYVLVEIPEGEIERARERIRKYNQGIIKEARKLWAEAEKKEKFSPYNALLDYRSIKEMLSDVDIAEAKTLSIRAGNKIDYLEMMEDPMIQLLSLRGNISIIQEVEFTDEYGKPKGEFSVDVGDYLRIKIDIIDDGYLYIISYDKEGKQARLLFPNGIERDNYVVKGVKVYPESTCFVAEAPPGYNTVFVIVSKEKIPIPTFTKDFIPLANEDVWKIIGALRRTKFDIMNAEIYIRE